MPVRTPPTEFTPLHCWVRDEINKGRSHVQIHRELIRDRECTYGKAGAIMFQVKRDIAYMNLPEEER